MAKRGEPQNRTKAAILLNEPRTAQMHEIIAAKVKLAEAAGLPIPTEQDLIRAWVDERIAVEAAKLAQPTK